MGDGIMALFAPLAHEDHAVYLLCGVADAGEREAVCRGHLAERGHSDASGLTLARSWFGQSVRIFTYTAAGRPHLAARMEQTAAGTILLTADALRLAEGFGQVPLGPTPVKGLNAPIEIYKLTGRAHALAYGRRRGPDDLRGRDTEMDTLHCPGSGKGGRASSRWSASPEWENRGCSGSSRTRTGARAAWSPRRLRCRTARRPPTCR
jgi:hypothetical protein